MNSTSIQNAWWPRISLNVLMVVILTGIFFRLVTGSGGLTKFNRTRLELPKTH